MICYYYYYYYYYYWSILFTAVAHMVEHNAYWFNE
jgi:hypothetical protein